MFKSDCVRASLREVFTMKTDNAKQPNMRMRRDEVRIKQENDWNIENEPG